MSYIRYELEMTFPSVQIRLDDEAMHIRQEEIEKKVIIFCDLLYDMVVFLERLFVDD